MPNRHADRIIEQLRGVRLSHEEGQRILEMVASRIVVDEDERPAPFTPVEQTDLDGEVLATCPECPVVLGLSGTIVALSHEPDGSHSVHLAAPQD